MQKSFEQSIAARIAVRNEPEHIRMRLTLRFCLFYFAAFAATLTLCRYTPVGSIPSLLARVEQYLTPPFAGCFATRDYIRAILLSSRYDLFALTLLALSGLTYFSHGACRAILFCSALRFGALCWGTVGLELRDPGAIPHGNLTFFIFFFAQLASAAVLLSAAVESVVFSYRYRDACRALRTQRDDLSYRYVLHTLACGGTVVVITALRMLLTFILET